MDREKQIMTDGPAELSQRLAEGLQRERIVPRFVDSYVVEHGRHALQVHASLYRDLLELLRREALLAVTARALEITYTEPLPCGRGKQRASRFIVKTNLVAAPPRIPGGLCKSGATRREHRSC